MESSIATSATSSIVAESCLSFESSQSTNHIKLLEISLISAEDLASVSKSMQTYAVTWINPSRKRTTQSDPHGHKNPEWTEKFVFRLNKDQMENATLTIEIYTISWFRDVLVGTVRVPVTELITPLLKNSSDRNMEFVTLQVRRPSGAPQGKLNMGVALLDSTMRSMTINNTTNNLEKSFHQQNLEPYEEDIETKKLKEKIHLWRSMSTGSSHLNNDDQRLSSHEGDGSVICSDIGPSASMVAGEGVIRLPAKGDDCDDAASSIIEVMTIEEAKARGYTVVAKEKGGADEGSTVSSTSSRRSGRRKSDGGLFSCFAYGIEFTVVCGSSKIPSNRKKGGKRRKPSEVNSA